MIVSSWSGIGVRAPVGGGLTGSSVVRDCAGEVDDGAVIGYVIGSLGCLFLAVTAAGWFRVFAHRGAAARGDGELAAELDRVAGRRTRRLAAAVIDLDGGPRVAFVGADENSRFEIGSVTKGLTGMLLAEAVRRGEVTLDATVGALLPDTAASPLGSVTLRELCTHTSGLPRMPRTVGSAARVAWCAWFGADPYRGLGPSTVLRLAGRQHLAHRGRQRYSNLDAAVLGQALAAVAGSEFPTLLTERVFTPIGMHATRIAARRADAAARGWTAAGRRSQPWLLSGYSPAGGVVSTIADMTLLATALLDGSAPGQAALDPIGNVTPDQPARAFGMSWVIDTVPGIDRTMVWHNGQTGGYSAFLALYPQTRMAVVVLANVARAAEQQRIAFTLTSWLVRRSQPSPGDTFP